MTTPEWKGLFEWSMKYHDGTRPSEFSAEDVDPEKMRWLEAALKNYMIDFNERMKEITQVFDAGENTDASIEEKAALLDELQDIVESVDHAKNLHTIGGLPTLMTILECPHPILRQKAAEVVSTCVQNNLPVQQWFRESGVLPPLMKLLTDENDMCQLRGWLAIGSLIRNYPEGENQFLSDGGGSLLLEAANSHNDKIRRRGLSLMQYLLRGESRKSLLDNGGVQIASGALDSENSEVRQAALGALIQAAEDVDGMVKVRQVGAVLEKATQIHKRLSGLPDDEREMFLEEMEAAEKLIEMLTRVAQRLWHLVVVKAELRKHLQVLKDYFLPARGQFFHNFLVEADITAAFDRSASRSTVHNDKCLPWVSIKQSKEPMKTEKNSNGLGRCLAAHQQVADACGPAVVPSLLAVPVEGLEMGIRRLAELQRLA